MNSPPKIVVISESSSQRLAFGQAIKSMGYQLIDCIPATRMHKVLHEQVDLWLIDSEDDVEVINQLTLEDKYLLGFTPSPNITDVKAFDKWQRHLKRKLMYLFGETDVELTEDLPTVKPVYQSLKRSWQCIFVLGASMGGPAAVKTFLDNLSADLPVAIVIAQHTDETAIKTLPQVLTMHNNWQCEVVTANAQLMAGKVWLLPPEKQVVFHTSGWLLPLQTPWQDQYKPSINKTMQSASDIFSQKVVHIIFSGMGNDGVNAAGAVQKSGGKIWVQTPDTCECDSQTTAMLETGYASFIGAPTLLAKHAAEYIRVVSKVRVEALL